jgi:DNA polymerase
MELQMGDHSFNQNHSGDLLFALWRRMIRMAAMSNAYERLLDGAIQHLEELKSRGVAFVPLSADGAAALTGLKRAGPPKKVAPMEVPARRVEPAAIPLKVESPKAHAQIDRPIISPAEPVVPAIAPVVSLEAKTAAFDQLRNRAMACVKCPHLAASRRQIVFGVGDISAQMMFVGEAPGADEDAQGEPFVGRAGQLLTKIIETMGLSRRTVYIANILKCRPDTPGQPTGNRKPTPEEMQTCIPFLHEQIDLVRPKVLVALGGTAVEGLLGKTAGITRLRGNWNTYRGIPLMPTYHPAYLLRNQALGEKRKVWEDMLQVMEKLGMTISDRQRRFFTKPSSL